MYPPVNACLIGNVAIDTTIGAKFYGPGAGYHIFAGKDATRSLTIGSLDPTVSEPRHMRNVSVLIRHAMQDLWKDWNDFDEEQLQALEEQKAFYRSKYPIVGRYFRDQQS